VTLLDGKAFSIRRACVVGRRGIAVKTVVPSHLPHKLYVGGKCFHVYVYVDGTKA
jgi:hypothetical protein